MLLFASISPSKYSKSTETGRNIVMNDKQWQPLATRMRPRTLAEFVGQQHLLGEHKPLRQAIEKQALHSMILWGPPGTGKTTFARMLVNSATARMESLSAVMSGVKDIRAVVVRAEEAQQYSGQPTVLFIDEIHRFNKAQQDAFLPYVEEGLLTLIGATTENPSFELNHALLSRTRVYVLRRLDEQDLLKVIQQALGDAERGLANLNIEFPAELQMLLAKAADGDARRALGMLEVAVDLVQEDAAGVKLVTEAVLQEVMTTGLRRFDKQGDIFYEQISALHKSVRGSSPDAALYWYCRMLDGGCDPLYIARRIVRMATEDIGIADPRGLEITLHAWDTYERLGSPEGDLAIAEAIVFLACCAKSNAVYTAFNSAMQDAQRSGSLDVPMHLRNAPTKLMKNIGYGKEYRYAHDEPDAYAKGEKYFPEELGEKTYYHPVERGLEIKVKAKLDKLRATEKLV